MNIAEFSQKYYVVILKFINWGKENVMLQNNIGSLHSVNKGKDMDLNKLFFQ